MINTTNLIFNRFNDLANNDSLSGFTDEYGRGWVAQQFHTSYALFFDFICDVKPKQILEIGTGEGGLTYFLNTVCKTQNIECKIRSYDTFQRPGDEWLRDAGIDQRNENIFNHNYDALIQNEVIDFIKRDGLTIVICDGGSKRNEFRIFSQHLKPKDFILAHDYAYDSNVFTQTIDRKIWNWLEITEYDIKESCELNGLTSYESEKFNQCAWVCKQKL